MTTGARPIDMVLHCPNCHAQHIDRADDPDSDTVKLERHRAANSIVNPTAKVWTNPPHRSHLCHACGYIWRPADVPTNGVMAVKTKGNDDSPVSPLKVPPDIDRALAALQRPQLGWTLNLLLSAVEQATAALTPATWTRR